MGTKLEGQECISDAECQNHSPSCPLPSSISELSYITDNITIFLEFVNFDQCVTANEYCLPSVYIRPINGVHTVCKKLAMPTELYYQRDLPESHVQWFVKPGELVNSIQSCDSSIDIINGVDDLNLCGSSTHSCVENKCIQFSGFTSVGIGAACSRVDDLFSTTGNEIHECHKPLVCSSVNVCEYENSIIPFGGVCGESWQVCTTGTYCNNDVCVKNQLLDADAPCGINYNGLCKPGLFCDETCKMIQTTTTTTTKTDISVEGIYVVCSLAGFAIGIGFMYVFKLLKFKGK